MTFILFCTPSFAAEPSTCQLIDPVTILLVPFLNTFGRSIVVVDLEPLGRRDIVGTAGTEDGVPLPLGDLGQLRVNDRSRGIDPLRPLGMRVPEHRRAVLAEAALRGRRLGRLVILVEREWGLVLPVVSASCIARTVVHCG